MSDWYYAKDQQQHGPVTKEALLSMLDRAELSSSDLAWTDGMGEWTEIKKISALVCPPPVVVGNNESSSVPPAAAAASAGSAVPPAGGASPYQTPQSTARPATIYDATPAPVSTNGFAITSLVLGCLALLGLLICIGPLFGVVGIIFGHLALVQIKRSEPAQPGRGLAITGLIFNYLSVLLVVVFIGFFGWLGASMPTTGPNGEPLSPEEQEEAIFEKMEGIFGPEIMEEARKSQQAEELDESPAEEFQAEEFPAAE